MRTIRVVIAGANEEKIFDLVDQFDPPVSFELFGVGKADRNFKENVSYFAMTDVQAAVTGAVRAAVDADILFKGLVQTHLLLKEVLKEEYQLRSGGLLSHVAILDIPQVQRPILLTDAAMNIAPDLEQAAAIVNNAVTVAQALGITQPKVALLSAAENFNPKMPSSIRGVELTQRFDQSEAIVYGPLSLDIALSKAIAQEKGFDGPIQGDADILVVPSIDVGNILYKSLTLFTSTRVGGMIVGAKIPIVLTSRGDSLANKVASLQFALDVISK